MSIASRLAKLAVHALEGTSEKEVAQTVRKAVARKVPDAAPLAVATPARVVTAPAAPAIIKKRSAAPSLLAAVRAGGKTYTGKTHLDAIAAIRDAAARKAAALDANSRGFVNERGRFLDRYKAADYARNFDLFSPGAPSWARTAPEVISENLKLPADFASDLTVSAAQKAAPEPSLAVKRTRATKAPAKKVPAAPPPERKPLPQTSPFAITGKADIGQEVLRKKAAQMELDPKKRIQPTGTDPVFDLSREAYEETPTLLPQSDPERVRAALPRLGVGEDYPAKNRIAPLIERKSEIAQRLAELAQGHRGTSHEYFYHTAPIVRGLQEVGVPLEGAVDFLRNRFAPAFAGSSPRTATEQNMRNATMLNYLRTQSVPLDDRFYDAFGNAPGYNMMGNHYKLAGQMFEGAHNPMTNPKPSAFLPNTAGDLSYVTADTHNIRGALKAFNDLYPGEVPPDWLYPKARARYADTGTLDVSKDIDDSLRSAARKGVETQVEYGPVADMTFEASRLGGIAPGPMQSLGWFGSGADTGLVSPPKTISHLMDERVNVTAQALGISPQEVLKLLSEGKIPLMAKGGAVDKDALAERYGV